MKGTNRTIIIPKGTLNSDNINIVVVPPSLQNTTQPLIVRPTSGNKLAALSLPIWGDELDSTPMGKARYERDSAPSPDSEFSDDLGFSDFESSVRCPSSPEGTPQLVHLRSRKVNVTDDAPPETFEMVFDAADGVDANVLETVLGQGFKEDSPFEPFTPREMSSLDELNFNPIFNSTEMPMEEEYHSLALADTAMYYPEVRSTPPPPSRPYQPRGGAYQPPVGCGGGNYAARYAQQPLYDEAYPMMQQAPQTQQGYGAGRKRGARRPKQSGCGGGCSS